MAGVADDRNHDVYVWRYCVGRTGRGGGCLAGGLSPMTWFAIVSKPQRELAAVEALTDLKVSAFTPVVSCWSSRDRIGSRRKRKLVTIPMFRGYLFIEANEVPWQSLRSCRETVRGIVAVSGLPVAIPAAQIEAVRALEAVGLPMDDEAPSPIIAGQTVEIISGPFTGKLTRVDAITAGRVVALIDTLGGKVRARIPADMVRAA